MKHSLKDIGTLVVRETINRRNAQFLKRELFNWRNTKFLLGAAVTAPATVTAYQWASGNNARTEQYQVGLNKLSAAHPFTAFDKDDKILLSQFACWAYAGFKFECEKPQTVGNLVISSGFSEKSKHGRMPITGREEKRNLGPTINAMLDKAAAENTILHTIKSKREIDGTGSGFVGLVLQNNENGKIYLIIPGLDFSNPTSKWEGVAGGRNAYFDRLRPEQLRDALAALDWVETEKRQHVEVVTISYGGAVGAALAAAGRCKVTTIDGPAIRAPTIDHSIASLAQNGIKRPYQDALYGLNANLTQIMTEVPTDWNANGGLVTRRTFVTNVQKPATPPGNSAFVLSNDWHSILTWGPPCVGLTPDKLLLVNQTPGNRVSIALNQKDDYSVPYDGSQTPPNGLIVQKMYKNGTVKSGAMISSGATTLPGDINQLLFLAALYGPSAGIAGSLAWKNRDRFKKKPEKTPFDRGL